MKFYALVLWRTRGVVPRQLKLIYLADRDTLMLHPGRRRVRTFRGAPCAQSGPRSREATELGEFRPSPSRLCDWCDHHARCPAFGGTPPPFPFESARRIDECTIVAASRRQTRSRSRRQRRPRPVTPRRCGRRRGNRHLARHGQHHAPAASAEAIPIGESSIGDALAGRLTPSSRAASR